MTIPNRGSIKDHGFIEILKEAARTGLTGMIRVENGQVIKVAYLQKGAISFASSNEKTDRLTEVLKRLGKLTPEQVEDAQARVKQNVSIGKTLVELGYISAKDLLSGARAQVDGILHQLLFWTEGKYQILEGALPREIIHLNLSIPSVIFEGIMNTQNREWILQHIGSPDAIYALASDFEDQNGILKLPAVAAVVSHLNGRRSLHEIAEKSDLDSFEICKTVVALERLDLATAIQDVPLQMDLSAPETATPEPPQILEEYAPTPVEESRELGQVLQIPTVDELQRPAAEPEPAVVVEPPAPIIVEPEPAAIQAEPAATEPEPVTKILDEPKRILQEEEEVHPIVLVPRGEEAEPAQDLFKSVSSRSQAATKSGPVWKGLITTLLVVLATALGFIYYKQNQKQEPVMPAPPQKEPAKKPEAKPPTITYSHPVPRPENQPVKVNPSAPTPPSPIDLLNSGKLAEAARVWNKQLPSLRNLYSIQLVIACQEKTILDTHRLMNYSEGIMVVPLSYKGQNCYRVLFGRFASKEAALAAVKTLPQEFLQQTSPASVIQLSQVR